MSAIKKITRKNVPFEDGVQTITAEYGISRIDIDNTRPYFSLTGVATGADGYQAHGQITEEILAAFPWLDLIARMHLADANTGEPLHAVENSWYWFVSGTPTGETADGFNTPASYSGMSSAERAASYLGCDPALFAGIRAKGLSDSTAKALFTERVNTLRPVWAQLATATRALYDLEV